MEGGRSEACLWSSALQDPRHSWSAPCPIAELLTLPGRRGGKAPAVAWGMQDPAAAVLGATEPGRPRAAQDWVAHGSLWNKKKNWKSLEN